MSMVFLLIANQVLGNLYCTTSSCSGCTSGHYLLFSSCLLFCPSGYFIDQKKCTAEPSQELFSLNFLSHRNTEGTSIGTFSHPESFPFSSTSRRSPVSTIDRGFYFFSTSYLESNTSWVLSPRFCISLYFKVLSPGTILTVFQNSTTFLEVSFKSSLEISFYSEDEISAEMVKKTSSVTLGVWKAVAFSIWQTLSYIYVFLLNSGSFIYGREFRMDSNNATFSLGSSETSGNSGFQGFLAYLTMENSNKCRDMFTLGNSCSYGEYLLNGKCLSCLDLVPSNPFCIRGSLNTCYSPQCTSCDGQMFDGCQNETDANFGNLAKNCLNGTGLTCFECEENFVLKDGICLILPSAPDEIVLRLDYFTMLQGGYFQSGHNASTYSPFNNPQADDPIAVRARGYFFNSSHFLSSSELLLSHSFTISIWAFISSNTLLQSNNINLYYDSSLIIKLSSKEFQVEEYVIGDCRTSAWKFFGFSVNFDGNSTHIRTFCDGVISKVQSISGFAYFDTLEEKRFSFDKSNNFLYRVTFSQFTVDNFTALRSICPGMTTNCFGQPNLMAFKNFVRSSAHYCHSSCTYGCSTWGTCNQCQHILCPSCVNFDETCVQDPSYSPCLSGYHLSEDSQSCCHSRCAMCFGFTSYSCTKCSSGYVLVGSFCALECPTGYSLFETICLPPARNIFMNFSFTKISDKFNDTYENTIFTGSTKDFYPTLHFNDPIPVQSRGFYFTSQSFVYTSNFTLPFNFSLGFWIRQMKPGILFTKGDLQITSILTLKNKNNLYQMISVSIGIWMNVNLGGNGIYDNYKFWSSISQSYYSSSIYENFFEDQQGPIYLGDDSQGFVGFLWKFVIFNTLNLIAEEVIHCNETFYSNCLWNCSLEQFVFNYSCKNCLDSCNQGCVRESDCNLCMDPVCYQCEFFNTSCKTCADNAERSEKCQCISGFFWKDDVKKCMPCIDHCSKCNDSQICITCNENFYIENNECVCKSGFFFNESVCLPCHETCLNCSGPGLDECNSCDNDKNFLNNTCVCKLGTYLSNSECLPCSDGCSECLNSSVCNTCKDNFYHINGSCLCPNQEYTSSLVCESCDVLCHTCKGTSDHDCLSCNFNLTLSETFSCVCNFSYYLVGYACLFCDPLAQLEVVENNCICKEGFYNENGLCNKCHNSCKSCKGPSEYDCLTCQTSITRQGDLCLCPTSLYWNGSSCASCESNPHLIADKFQCICEDGYYLTVDQTCERCNSRCHTCFGPLESECLSCKDDFYLKDFECECRDGFYRNGFNCYPCTKECPRCQGPGLNGCLCEDQGVWNKCQCPVKLFWNLTCQDCHSSCLNCIGSQYFQCSVCENYLLEGICFDSCPRGFQPFDKVCFLSDFLSLSFHFDSDSALVERISKKTAIFPDKTRKIKPFTLPDRGIFFPEESDRVLFEAFSIPFLSPTFFISIWVKVDKGSEIFSLKSSEEFSCQFKMSQNGRFYINLNGFKQEIGFKVERNQQGWHLFLFNIIFNVSHQVIVEVDGGKIVRRTLPEFPYKDSNFSELNFGSLFGDIFSGFIYSFEIFTTKPFQDYLIKVQEGECEISPSSSSKCLSSCKASEYSTGSKCQTCNPECKFGCKNISKCLPCPQKNCEICNTLEPFSCLKCKSPNELNSGLCIPCRDFFYFDMGSCKSCPSLCKSCSSNSSCESCVKNSELFNSTTCNCLFGFEANNSECSQLFFKAFLTQDFSNKISIFFDEPLKEPLKVKDLSLKVNSKKVKFLLKMINFSMYSLQTILDDDLNFLKNRIIFIEFSESLISLRGSSLEKNVFQFKMFDEGEERTGFESLKSSGKTLTTVGSLAALASGAVLMNPTIFFNFMNLVEIFAYSLLFDVDFHPSFIEFMINLKKSTKLPSLKFPIKGNNKELPEKFLLYDVDSSLVMTIFYLLFRQPFAENKENWFMLVNEFLLLVFYLMFFLDLLKFINVGQRELALISMRIVIGTLAFNIFCNSFKAVRKIGGKIWARIKERNSRVVTNEHIITENKIDPVFKFDE